MKEVKFRAWHKEEKNMGSVVSIEFSDDGSGEIEEIEVFLGDEVKKPYMTEDEIKFFKLMQYTGLNDKNGNEIYEGDICLVFGISEEVVFYNAAFGYWIWNTEKYRKFIPLCQDNIRSDYIEVIGNIYENPELLNEH